MTQIDPIAVLTGDIVESTSLGRDRLESVFAALEDAAEELSLWQEADPKLTRFRGDGWQLVVMRPTIALRAALFLRAAIRRHGRDLDTRISIGTGAVDALPDGDLSGASGSAFVSSGRGLDQIRKTARIASDGSGPLRAATLLADTLTRGWSPAQAAVAYYALNPDRPTQSEIGEAVGSSQQNVQKVMEAAHLPDILTALNALETA
ncbi:hypothetical protein [Poseidonocella pacifica]|nr:hypothetical protein [Poseidonocella pacifica]